jgi:hypothetical protein
MKIIEIALGLVGFFVFAVFVLFFIHISSLVFLNPLVSFFIIQIPFALIFAYFYFFNNSDPSNIKDIFKILLMIGLFIFLLLFSVGWIASSATPYNDYDCNTSSNNRIGC